MSKIDANKIKFYTSSACGDCTRAKLLLGKYDLDVEYINIDEQIQAADEVIRINKGYRSVPTIIFPNGRILVEPTSSDLEQAVMEYTK